MKAIKANPAALKKLGVREFDVANYLTDEETIAEYLNQILADGDAEELIEALGDIARARGMTSVAAASGLGRNSLYKAFKPDSKPQFDTIFKVMRAIGVEIHAVAAPKNTAVKPKPKAKRKAV